MVVQAKLEYKSGNKKKIAKLQYGLKARLTKSFSILGLLVLQVCFGMFAEQTKRAEPRRKRRGVVYCNFTKKTFVKCLT